MSWLDKAWGKIANAFGNKSAGGSKEKCPLEETGLAVIVMRVDGNEPVQGAIVDIKGKTPFSKKTDDVGLALFKPVEPDNYGIKVTLPKNLADTHEEPAAECEPVALGAESTHVIPVLPLASIKVKVLTNRKTNKEKNLDGVTIHIETTDGKTKLDQKTKPDGTVKFEKLGEGEYLVSVTDLGAHKQAYGTARQKFYLSFVDGADEKVLPDGAPPRVPIIRGDQAEVVIELVAVLRVYLALQFKDPDPNEKPRFFPENLTLKLVPDQGTPIEAVVGKNGVVSQDKNPWVDVPRTAKAFTLDFTQADAMYVVCEKPKAAKVQEIVAHDGVNAKIKAGQRVFRLPSGTWTLQNSDWEVDNVPAYKKDQSKFADLENSGTTVGSQNQAVKLVLNPHWQYVRFVYYDRKLKGAEPISIPAVPNGDVLPVCIEGWRKKDDHKNHPAAPDTRCFWAIGDDDKKTVQCLPWIIQKDKQPAGGFQAKPKPDADTILQFKRAEAHPFIYTKDANDRKLVNFTNALVRDKPGVERLAYYDLPTVWKSRSYFGWLSDTAGEYGPYEDVVTKETKKDKPLVFSLDDIVLTDDALHPLDPAKPAGDALRWDTTTRVALFSNTFAGSGAAPAATGPAGAVPANKPQPPTPAARRYLAHHGLYNPDTDHDQSYFSKIKMDVNYVADYPYWTRLVVAAGNLFDVFDKRTPDSDAGVVGARAAVRWTDATAGKPANSVVARPGRIDKNFFAVQPYYEQEYAQRFSYTPYDPTNSCALGRFDLALLRCCDVSGGNEKAVNMVYFRITFNIAAGVLTAPLTNAKYADGFVTNVAKRWNGDDTVSTKRAQLLPSKSPAAPLLFDVVWFGQSLAVAQSQFKCDVVNPPPPANPRSWFNGTQGTGELSPTGYKDTGNWFVGAHECGHGNTLNDDYCERWDANSYGQLSFRWHLPGDPFEPDGRIVEFGEPGAAMMNGNQEIRNRYFWHCCEWVRRAANVSLKVKLGTYDDYRLPPHPSAARTYAVWPMEAKTKYEPDSGKNRGLFGAYLYAVGKERYTVNLLPHASAVSPFDGILVVMVQIRCKLPSFPLGGALDPALTEAGRKNLLQKMAAIIRQKMNDRFCATGTVKQGKADERTFSKCLIQFSPRFLVQNHHAPSAAPGDPAGIANGMGVHFDLELKYVAAPGPPVPRPRWVDPAAAEPAEVMTLMVWGGKTGAPAGARNPADADLDALDIKVDNYHKTSKADYDAIITLLDEIIALTDSWMAKTTGPLTSPPDYVNRQAGVQELNAQANSMRTYVQKIKASRDFLLEYNTDANLQNAFQLHFPSMLGIYKSPDDVQEADLLGLVKQVITTNAAVAKL